MCLKYWFSYHSDIGEKLGIIAMCNVDNVQNVYNNRRAKRYSYRQKLNFTFAKSITNFIYYFKFSLKVEKNILIYRNI